MEKITGSEALLRALIAEGVDTIFGYPGGAVIPVYDCLYDYKDKLKHVLVRHEQGATHAAQGYARVSGKVGVALVTSGPGATNTLTGIADAMMDSTPLVVITGQVASSLLGTGLGGIARFLYRLHGAAGTGGARFRQGCPGGDGGIRLQEGRLYP